MTEYSLKISAKRDYSIEGIAEKEKPPPRLMSLPSSLSHFFSHLRGPRNGEGRTETRESYRSDLHTGRVRGLLFLSFRPIAISHLSNSWTMAPPLATVGIASIGEMGLGIAKLLSAHNYRVLTNVSSRRSADLNTIRVVSSF